VSENEPDKDKKQELEEKLAALPRAAKEFVVGYGEGTAGYKPEKTPKHTDESDRDPDQSETYTLNLSAATNRVCLRCGSVVADLDLHDEFHARIKEKKDA
jgi:hypothetical protein